MGDQDQQSEYSHVCKQLDAHTLTYFETLETLLKTRARFTDTMKEGYFLMSKARYSMGAKSVGALQYDDCDMTAKYVVQTSEQGDGGCTGLRVVDMQADGGKSPVQVENVGTHLRKRTVGKKSDNVDDVSDLADDVRNLNVNVDDKSDSPQWKDPIKWFGVLVPQTLRQSQKEFQRLIEMSAEIVNLQEQLLTIKGEFHTLLSKKKLLKRAAGDD